MFPGLEKGLCVLFFKSRVTSRKFNRVLVYFDRDSQTVISTQLTLIDCYLPEKPTGPHNVNFAHLVLTVLIKGANLDLKIASAIILN